MVVVIREMRWKTFSTEVEKGSWKSVIRSGLADPKKFIKYENKWGGLRYKRGSNSFFNLHRIEREIG